MEQTPRLPSRFLDRLHPETQAELFESGTEVKYDAGDLLYEEGSPATNMFLIVNGQVKLTKVTSDGRVFTLFLKQDRELLGEGTLIDNDVSSLSAKAVTFTTARKIPVKEMYQLFMKRPDLARQLMSWYAVQTQSAQAKFRDLILSGKQGALYSTLIRLAHSYGKETDRGIIITTPLTHQDLATFAGSTRENINRMMTDLKESGILTMQNGQIVIHELNELKQYMQCWSCPIDICTM